MIDWKQCDNKTGILIWIIFSRINCCYPNILEKDVLPDQLFAKDNVEEREI